MPAYTESLILPYTPQQIFDVVADVKNYPLFLPWCTKAVTYSHSPREFMADLWIGYHLLQGHFTSHVKLSPPLRIEIVYKKGPFSHLENYWNFEEVAQGCQVTFFIDFDFTNLLFRTLILRFFKEAVHHITDAFQKRAQELYHPKSVSL